MCFVYLESHSKTLSNRLHSLVLRFYEVYTLKCHCVRTSMNYNAKHPMHHENRYEKTKSHIAILKCKIYYYCLLFKDGMHTVNIGVMIVDLLKYLYLYII